MRDFRLAMLCILLASAGPAAWSQDQGKAEDKLPRDAQALIDAYEKTAAKLDDEHRRKLNTEREKLLAALDKSCKDEGRKGNIDGAIVIKERMATLKELIAKDDDTDMLGGSMGMPIEMIGTWDIVYSNRCTRKIAIDAKGGVQVLESNWGGAGTSYAITIDERRNLSGPCFTGRIESYSVKAGKLVIDHWIEGTHYATGAPAELTAVGTRAKEDTRK